MEVRLLAHNITLIPGDGTGPEITAATRRVIDGTGVDINWEVLDAGVDVMDKYGTPLPEHVLESIRRNKVALKGPITTPIGTGFRSVNVALRKELNLYACLRPCKYYPGIRSKYTDVDLVIARENTEDLYAGVEWDLGTEEAKQIINMARGKIREDAAISIKPISITGTRQIAKFAFDYAIANSRKCVTAVAKANIMKFTDGLFYQEARRVAKAYGAKFEWEELGDVEPDPVLAGKVDGKGAGIVYQERLVDNMCMQLVQKPELYDVLVLPNLYGDILSDLCAGLVGGLGVAPGANLGDEAALFEPTHGSAPKYTGQNKVNPMAMILSGMLMLRHIGEREAADRLEQAVARIIAEGKYVTYDMKPHRDDPTAVGTSEVADAIIREMQAGSRQPTCCSH
ncbi:MAG: isocitrate/isopropylmalate dehydrogenase family protein [Armatimonadetes bacterium]|nr:isocitrate/isopropylmalate dehydrogenase family protein [Armatimonadota bacterium]